MRTPLLTRAVGAMQTHFTTKDLSKTKPVFLNQAAGMPTMALDTLRPCSAFARSAP